MNTTFDALVAEVCVSAHGAHVADTLDGSNLTTVTDDRIMDSGILVSFLVAEVVGEHLLEGRVAVVLDLLADHGGDGRELFGNKSASSVALAAWQTLLVHLRAVALEAGHFFEVNIITVVIGGDEQVTGDIHVFDFSLHLGLLILHVGNHAVTRHVFDVCSGLA